MEGSYKEWRKANKILIISEQGEERVFVMKYTPSRNPGQKATVWDERSCQGRQYRQERQKRLMQRYKKITNTLNHGKQGKNEMK